MTEPLRHREGKQAERVQLAGAMVAAAGTIAALGSAFQPWVTYRVTYPLGMCFAPSAPLSIEPILQIAYFVFVVIAGAAMILRYRLTGRQFTHGLPIVAGTLSVMDLGLYWRFRAYNPTPQCFPFTSSMSNGWYLASAGSLLLLIGAYVMSRRYIDRDTRRAMAFASARLRSVGR